MTRRKLLPQKTHRAQSSCSVFSAARSASLAVKPANARRGISLIEVLISMFVLLFGLMGVAAIFPVGNHYVVEGEKFDLGAALAQNAFEELKARGMLRPEAWLYPNEFLPFNTPALKVITAAEPNQFQYHSDGGSDGPGNVFVLDPLGGSEPVDSSNAALQKTFFPFQARTARNVWNSSNNSNYAGEQLRVYDGGAGSPYEPVEWPVRRVTIPVPSSVLDYEMIPRPVGETIFRLRDDLAVEQPDKSDVPSQQRWDTLDVNAAGNPNDTPDDPSDDQLLRRQYKGDYSWLATIVPTTGRGLQALQPASPDYGQIACDVSVVVFRKRDLTPSDESERLIEAELLVGGELVIFNRDDDKQLVDDAVDDIRAGNWIALMGVNQTTGDFIMKWYRILAMDDETLVNQNINSANGVALRRMMLIGPDWPSPAAGATFVPDLRACILPGAISVVTKPLRMESSSLWDLE